jgi:pyruvate dehydrogenase E1 component beta subunit
MPRREAQSFKVPYPGAPSGDAPGWAGHGARRGGGGERRGARLEILDLCTISPLDGKAITESVKHTGRCVVVQEAPRHLGVASEVVARANDQALLYLEAPVRRATGYDVCTPYFGRELHYIPDVKRIVQAIEETLDF